MAATTTSRKRKGRGNIQKKANGNYLGRLRIAGYDTFYVTGTSEKEVQKELDQFYLKTLKKEIIPQKQTVNSYIEQWLTSVKMPSLKAASYDPCRTQSAWNTDQYGNPDIDQLLHHYAFLFQSQKSL